VAGGAIVNKLGKGGCVMTDLNKLAEKLRKQKEVSVNREGQLEPAAGGNTDKTKLEPNRFGSN